MKANGVPIHIAVQFRHLLRHAQSLGYSVAAVFAFSHDVASTNDLVWFIADKDNTETRMACLQAARKLLGRIPQNPDRRGTEVFSVSAPDCSQSATCVAVEVVVPERPGLFVGILLWGEFEAEDPVAEVLLACSSVMRSFFVACFGEKSGREVAVLGVSPEFQRLLQTISTIGPCDQAPVLISGERGSGKEAAALALHYYSKRRSKPFLSVNCAALTEQLYVSELFGCCRGAYTGADSDRKGKFALAHGGTLFLDEITEIPAVAYF